MQQKLVEKERAQKEDHLRLLAQQAREERSNARRGGRRASSARSSRSPSSSYSSRSRSPSSDEEAIRERDVLRRERRQEYEKKMRQSRMGQERRIQMLAREQNRDISEKVALGLAKPTQNADSMYDARLFNQTSGFDAGFNEDQPYDKPLFAAQEAIQSVYRPSMQHDDNDEEAAAGEAVAQIQKASRFEVLGKAAKGFKGAETAEPRSGPVVFEKDADPHGVEALFKSITAGQAAASGEKRYGIQEDERSTKRARVEDDD